MNLAGIFSHDVASVYLDCRFAHSDLASTWLAERFNPESKSGYNFGALDEVRGRRTIAVALLDLMRTHQFAIARRHGIPVIVSVAERILLLSASACHKSAPLLWLR
jgi:hypothetical protein